MGKRKALGVCFLALALFLSGCGASRYTWTSEAAVPSGQANAEGRPAMLSVESEDELVEKLEALARRFVPEADIIIRQTPEDAAVLAETALRRFTEQTAFAAYAEVSVQMDILSEAPLPHMRLSFAYGQPQAGRDRLWQAETEADFWESVKNALKEYKRSLDVEFLFSFEEETQKQLSKHLEALLLNEPQAAYGLESFTFDRFWSGQTLQIASLRFKYGGNNVTLLSFADQTRKAAANLAAEVLRQKGSETDHGLFYNLYFALLSQAEFTAEGTADLSGDGALLATAYGPLVEGKATAKGFAQGFQLLCDEAGLACYVMAGRLDGKTHYWNLVSLGDVWYHTDLGEGARQEEDFTGKYFSFNDRAAQGVYDWDFRPEGKECKGSYFTYERLRRLLSEESP